MYNYKDNLDKKSINYSLNFIKFIAIIAVICIHCQLNYIGTKGLVINALSRFAVPIFFLISGFFSYYANNSQAMIKYRNRIIRLVKLFVIGNILYLGFDIYTCKISDFSSIVSVFDLNHLFNYIFLDVSPWGVHLWFILALIYCYVLYYILTKINISPQSLYKYVPILVLFALFLGEFTQKMGINFPIGYYRNFLFMGLPFFTLGFFLHEKDKILINFSNLSLISLAAFGFLLTILEVLVVGKSDIFVGTIIFAVSIFIWCIKNPNKLKFGVTEFIGGKLYALIYILHFLIVQCINSNLGYLRPIIAFIVAVIVSSIIYIVFNQLKKYSNIF